MLAIQKQGDQIIIIDEVYIHRKTLDEVIDICKTRDWWKAGNVRKLGVIDIAGRAHNPMASPVEAWLQRAGITMKSERVSEKGGIELLRSMMKPHPVTNKPAIQIDQKCLGLICEMGGGKPPELTYEQTKTHSDLGQWGPWVYDINSELPVNKHNHSCKTLFYYLANKVGWKEIGKFGNKARVKSYI